MSGDRDDAREEARPATAEQAEESGEHSASPARRAGETAVFPTRIVPGDLEIHPAKGYAAARFEAIVSRQAQQAYEARQRVTDDATASSGHLFDAPT